MGGRMDPILSFFFAAMQDGYAKNNGGTKQKKGTILELPGSKTISFVRKDFELLDCWFAPEKTTYSSGQTFIWHKGTLVWAMSYLGQYPEDAIPFLKRALRETYKNREFVGGRGPDLFEGDGMIYINRVEPPNDWRHFRGREEIFDQTGQNIGWHEYQGLLLMS